MHFIKENWLYRQARLIYHENVSFTWKNRIELFVLGESDIYRPMFKEVGCIMIHVPKVAGISIAHALYGRSTGHYTAALYKHVSATEFAKYFKFAFVRNPWDRVVSAYSFVKQGGTDLVAPADPGIYKAACFDTFKTFVSDWLQHQDLLAIDLVFAPQYHFVCDNNYDLLVDFIGKFENFQTDVQYIAERLHRNIEIGHLNQSNTKKDYRCFYDAETVDLVAKIYEKDVQLFNYDFDK